MSEKEELAKRLRTYLARGARRSVPSGMEDRILTRVTAARRTTWVPQVLAAAAVIGLAVGVGIVFQTLRSQRNVLPAVSPSPKASVSPTPQGIAGPYPLLPPTSFRMINASTGWAAGAGTDRILRTTDGGAHWQDVSPGAARAGTWTPDFLDASTAWFASSVQPGSSTPDFSINIYWTSNGGQSWQQVGQVLPDQGWPAGLDFVDSHRGWLMLSQGSGAGSQGVAFYGTVDSGATWTKLSEADTSGAPGHLPVGCQKAAPVFLNTSTGWTPGACNAGGGPFLYVTHDGGRTWLDARLSVPAAYGGNCQCEVDAMAFSDSRNGTFVVNGAGADGQAHSFLYASHDAGTTWAHQPLPTAATVVADFINASQGWTLDAKTNTIYSTTDGGRHWSSVAPIPSSQGVMDIDFVDPNVGWAIGSEAQGNTILKTTDGGRSWTTQLSPSPATPSPTPISSPAPAAPSARAYAAAAFDTKRGVFVLFGGRDASGLLNDTWTWDGSAWTLLHPVHKPQPRERASMAYDQTAGVTVLQGGANLVPETWIWDGTDWTQRATNEPPTNGVSSGTEGSFDVLAYDADRKQVVLFDGVGPWPNREFNQVWAWDGNSWIMVPTTGADVLAGQSNNPAGFAYHAASKSEVLFGRLQEAQPITWTLTAGTWHQASQVGTSSRNFNLGSDEGHGTLVLFGEQGDTWTWDGLTWTLQHPVSFPPPRSNAATAYDPVRKLTLLFGGVTGQGGVITGAGGTFFDDLWGWDGRAWRNLSQP